VAAELVTTEPFPQVGETVVGAGHGGILARWWRTRKQDPVVRNARIG
jgi:hypothetical protein